MYVYKQTERGEYPLWTVGFYTPSGEWEAESDHSSKDEAAERVAYLNGNKGEATTYPCVMCSYRTDMKHLTEWKAMCYQCYVGETEYHISENGRV